jgi:hypothetical protein
MVTTAEQRAHPLHGHKASVPQLVDLQEAVPYEDIPLGAASVVVQLGLRRDARKHALIVVPTPDFALLSLALPNLAILCVRHLVVLDIVALGGRLRIQILQAVAEERCRTPETLARVARLTVGIDPGRNPVELGLLVHGVACLVSIPKHASLRLLPAGLEVLQRSGVRQAA